MFLDAADASVAAILFSLARARAGRSSFSCRWRSSDRWVTDCAAGFSARRRATQAASPLLFGLWMDHMGIGVLAISAGLSLSALVALLLLEGAAGAHAGGGIARALAPGTRGYTKGIVVAQMPAQIGAFALPALLPDYIARWNLSKTEAKRGANRGSELCLGNFSAARCCGAGKWWRRHPLGKRARRCRSSRSTR